MKCPYCNANFKPGVMAKYKLRNEEEAPKEPRLTFLCTCTRAQGMRWNIAGEVEGEATMVKGVKPLNAKE